MELLDLLPYLKDYPIVGDILVLVIVGRFLCRICASMLFGVAGICGRIESRVAAIIGKASWRAGCFLDIFADGMSKRYLAARYQRRGD